MGRGRRSRGVAWQWLPRYAANARGGRGLKVDTSDSARCIAQRTHDSGAYIPPIPYTRRAGLASSSCQRTSWPSRYDPCTYPMQFHPSSPCTFQRPPPARTVQGPQRGEGALHTVVRLQYCRVARATARKCKGADKADAGAQIRFWLRRRIRASLVSYGASALACVT